MLYKYLLPLACHIYTSSIEFLALLFAYQECSLRSLLMLFLWFLHSYWKATWVFLTFLLNDILSDMLSLSNLTSLPSYVFFQILITVYHNLIFYLFLSIFLYYESWMRTKFNQFWILIYLRVHINASHTIGTQTLSNGWVSERMNNREIGSWKLWLASQTKW